MRWRDLVTPLMRPKQIKTSMAGPLIAWSQIGLPKWTPRRYDKLADEAYRKNVVAFRCVSLIASTGAGIPVLLYDQNGAEVDRHALLDLLVSPNPLQERVTFFEKILSDLLIAGNAYVEAVSPLKGGRPRELYTLRPDRMKVIPGPYGLPQGYEYTLNGQTTRWSANPLTGDSAILHIKLFHPLDDWYGMSPLEAALLSVDQHNAAGAWNQSLLSHGARPSGALVFAPKEGPASLSDEQVRRLREEMDRLYEGAPNAGRPLVLEGGLEWREMSLSPKDMDWIAGKEAAARDIAMAFGVPAQLIGLPDAQSYANMAEARVAFYEETVLPLINRVLAQLDGWLTPQFDPSLSLDLDQDQISALTGRRDVLWSKVGSADFLTINEKREALGYGPIEGGETLSSLKNL